MLTTNIEIDVEIKISKNQSICVNINNETGYITDVRENIKSTGVSDPLISLNISKNLKYPIILPNTLQSLNINTLFNQHIVLPNSLTELLISGQFNQPIIIPNTIKIFNNWW